MQNSVESCTVRGFQDIKPPFRIVAALVDLFPILAEGKRLFPTVCILFDFGMLEKGREKGINPYKRNVDTLRRKTVLSSLILFANLLRVGATARAPTKLTAAELYLAFTFA